MKNYLDTYGFKFDLCELCVANTLTILLCVDELKASHKNTKVVYNYKQWIKFMRGDSNIGKVKSVIGQFHEYLSIALYYTTKGEENIDMQKYVKNMIDEFPIKIEKA